MVLVAVVQQVVAVTGQFLAVCAEQTLSFGELEEMVMVLVHVTDVTIQNHQEAETIQVKVLQQTQAVRTLYVPLVFIDA